MYRNSDISRLGYVRLGYVVTQIWATRIWATRIWLRDPGDGGGFVRLGYGRLGDSETCLAHACCAVSRAAGVTRMCAPARRRRRPGSPQPPPPPPPDTLTTTTRRSSPRWRRRPRAGGNDWNALARSGSRAQPLTTIRCRAGSSGRHEQKARVGSACATCDGVVTLPFVCDASLRRVTIPIASEYCNRYAPSRETRPLQCVRGGRCVPSQYFGSIRPSRMLVRFV